MATKAQWYKQYFCLDGEYSRNYGVGISGSGVYRSSERDISTEHIFGRNGDLLTDNGAFLNRIITYPCWMARTFKDDFNAFRAWLMAHSDKYYRLWDTYNVHHFFRARFVGPLEPEVLVMRKAGKFDVQFDCKPQWYMDEGEIPVAFSSSGTITNPTLFPSSPVVTIVGTGTVSIGGQEIEVLASCPYNTITVDCETMDAYADDAGTRVSVNQHVILPIQRIVINSGEVSVNLSGVDSVSILPMWYTM